MGSELMLQQYYHQHEIIENHIVIQSFRQTGDWASGEPEAAVVRPLGFGQSQ